MAASLSSFHDSRTVRNLSLRTLAEDIETLQGAGSHLYKGQAITRVRTQGEWRPLRYVFDANSALDGQIRVAKESQTRVGSKQHAFWLASGPNAADARLLVVMDHVDDPLVHRVSPKITHPNCIGCQLAHYDQTKEVEGLPANFVRDAKDGGTPIIYLRITGTVNMLAGPDGKVNVPWIYASSAYIIEKRLHDSCKCESALMQEHQSETQSLQHLLPKFCIPQLRLSDEQDADAKRDIDRIKDPLQKQIWTLIVEKKMAKDSVVHSAWSVAGVLAFLQVVYAQTQNACLRDLDIIKVRDAVQELFEGYALVWWCDEGEHFDKM